MRLFEMLNSVNDDDVKLGLEIYNNSTEEEKKQVKDYIKYYYEQNPKGSNWWRVLAVHECYSRFTNHGSQNDLYEYFHIT